MARYFLAVAGKCRSVIKRTLRYSSGDSLLPVRVIATPEGTDRQHAGREWHPVRIMGGPSLAPKHRAQVKHAAHVILLAASVGALLSATALALPRPQNQTTASPPVFKVQTEVVNVYAVVKDRKGRLVPDLTRNDFELTEDGTPQQIRYFARDTRTPLTMCIMIDTSPSQGRVLATEQRQAEAFLQEVMQPKDLASVLHFDVQVELLQDFTASLPMLSRAVDETVINGGGQGPMPSTFPVTGGATHLYDAVWLASNDLMKNEVGRKVMILLTDGQDQGSSETLNGALQAAMNTDSMVYSVDIVDRGFYGFGSLSYNGGPVLQKLSGETGGTVIRVTRTKNAAEAFNEIANELRSQYWLGYTPTNQARDGTYRRIQVRVRTGNYKVQARQGYYAPGK
jgi:VWFA-related protein